MRCTLLAAGAIVALPLAGCATASATTPLAAPAVTRARATASAPVPSRTRAAATPARPVDRITAMAQRQYGRETGGAVARAELLRIASEPGLRSAARSGSVTALRAYVNQRFSSVWYHQHVSRLQIVRAGSLLVDTGVPFVVDGPHVTLPGGDTLRISIQDEIGFVRLIHRHNPVDVVVRGQGGQVRSSLPAATTAALPPSGRVTIAGVRYDVRSFARTALGGEPVQVWILSRG
jgi:hypothetical protein